MCGAVRSSVGCSYAGDVRVVQQLGATLMGRRFRRSKAWEERNMRTRLAYIIVGAIVLFAMSVCAFGQAGGIDVVTEVQKLLPATCLTKAQVDPILNAMIPGSAANLTVAGGCITKAEFANYEFAALGLKRGIFEILFVTKAAYAQDHCLLVLGRAADALTGMEFAVTLMGVVQYINSTSPAPASLSADAVARLLTISHGIDLLTPSSVDSVLLPCLVIGPVPTS